MVDAAGGGDVPSFSRCQRMVWAPLSWPVSVSSWRSSRMRLTVCGGVARGLVCGRLDWGSRACRPPWR